MARAFMVSGVAYKMEFAGDRKSARVYDAGKFLGTVEQHARPDGVEVWRGLGGRVYAKTAEGTAKELVRRHLGRSSFDAALVEAYNEKARRDHRAAEAAQRREFYAKREAEARERRATLPMLSVLTRDDTAWTEQGVVKFTRPDEVQVYGERAVSMYVSHRFTDGIGDMTVSTSGRSDLTPSEAREYALALLRAADEAERWNLTVKPTLRVETAAVPS